MNLDNVKARLIRFEGRIPHMYQCTGGEVTIGVGHAITGPQEARTLELRHRDQRAASPTEIQHDFRKIREMHPGLPVHDYRSFTELILPEPEIDAILDTDIAFFTKALHESFRLFDSYPEPAQEAVFDMAFNLGIVGLFQKFPKCVKAIVMKDWNRASSECHRRGISEERNQETAKLFTSALGIQ
jgi:GH24 family phage-related lysozyme (muramidase)